MLYVSWVLATSALFVPFVFLPAFAVDQGASHLMASTLISVLGGMSIVGRLGLGALADHIGTLRLFKIATFDHGRELRDVADGKYGIWLRW